MEEKETKNKFWKGVLVGALVTAFAGFAVVGFATGIWIIGRRTSESQSIQATGTDANKLDMKKIEPKLQYMEALIDKYFLFDENMTEEEQKKNGTAEDWIYRGYMYSLNDPYSVYYDKDEYTSLNEENSGTYCGIGVQVSQNVYTGIITAVKVFKDSPAQEAGMLHGDNIYKVEDIEATGEDLSLLVSDHIRGEEGTKVHLTVYRQSTDEYVEMDVERRMVENPTVEYEMLENKAGYISLSSFEEVSSEQFKKAVDDLTAQGMEKLIVDLRNNGGGVVQAAKEIADYLLPDGKTIVSFKGKGIDDSTYSSDDGHEVYVPIVLLVNGESASASEVLTGALKDNNWATIVGEKTFGKGIAQGVFNLPDGSGLELLRRLRARSALPVLILTANDLELDQVTGLELGADDYVTKPFSLAVLRARVNNLLRRAHSRRTVLELPPFTFDFQEMTYTRNGVPLELSRTEQRLLRLLAEHRGQTLPRARLLEQVWDGGEFVDENALSVAVNRLRAKLTDAPIRTVYGVGYVWAVEP